jgi:nucleoid-associated protein EbfC
MNIQEIMQQAQAMQSKMQELQNRLADEEVEGAAGGGMVTIRATCKGEVRNIDIDDSLMQPSEKEMLEDLIKAALNDAKSRADTRLADETQSMMKELGLPANMQLPF